MTQWNVGILECWNVGMLECWNVGMLDEEATDSRIKKEWNL
ncbi:MAG: hypothetical protein U9N53_12315 [Bacteroidota bacterium]|nr:hypothetical protein [Bacteroidota bacterium]